MSTTNPNPEAAQVRVPGWATIPTDNLDDDRLDDEALDDPPPTDPTTTPPPPTSDRPNPNPLGAEADTGPAAPSTRASRPTDDDLDDGWEGGDDDDGGPGRPVELSPHLDDELGALGASLFDIAGRVANRAHRARTKTESRLWLATDEEAEAFGAAAARMAARRMPAELAEDGDGSDVLIMGSVALGYVLRNAAGEAAPGPPPAEWSQAPPPQGPPPRQGPPPPPPAAQAPSVLTPDL